MLSYVDKGHNNVLNQEPRGHITYNKRLWPLIFAIFCSSTYLLFLPGGLPGYGLPLLAFIIACLHVNLKSLGVFCLLIGPPSFGGIFRSFDVPYAGTFVAYGLAIGSLHFYGKRVNLKVINWYPAVVLWIFFLIGTLFISYFLGPQTDYSFNKLAGVLQGLTLSIISFLYLLKSRDCDMWEVGILGFFAGFATYAATLYTFPSLSPNNIFITAELRFSAGLEDIKIATNTIALIISTGLVFIFSSLANDKFDRNRTILTFVAIFSGFILLNSIGQRLFILLPIICALSIHLCTPRNKKLIFILSSSLIIALSISIYIGIQTQNTFIDAVFTENTGIAERTNRIINWEAATARIKERPWLGHGLGGYYIQGYSTPGSGTYAHNMLLELLSEVGIIGTLIILGPVIFFLFKYLRKLIMFRTARGQIVFPTFVLLIGHSMISHDLTKSAWLFGLIVCLWLYQINIIKRRDFIHVLY